MLPPLPVPDATAADDALVWVLAEAMERSLSAVAALCRDDSESRRATPTPPNCGWC